MRRFGGVVLAALIFVASAAAEDSKEGKLWLGAQKNPPGVELNLPSFAPVIEKLGGAVVNVSSEGREDNSNQPKTFRFQGPNGAQPQSPFDFFFQVPPDGQGGERTFASLGSGFVIHPDGYIVTNNHVVDHASKILVTFRDDKTEYEAKVIGSDRKTDIALLKIDAQKPLEAVVLGDSDNLKTGDWVIAIGNPFRLGHTATVGIVSAKSRKVPGGGPYDDFIQTDASINPGNSGGPLFNARGEVIGINTAIYSPGRMGGGFNIGIGFATPINLVKTILAELHEKGKVTRGWLGVLIQPVSPDLAAALGLEKAEGALVADVLPKSPANKAGIQRGDVITHFDGKAVTENDDLPRMVADTEINKEVEIQYVRQHERKTLKVKIEQLTEETETEAEPAPEENKTGLFVQELTPDIARSLGVEETEGVVVSHIAPGSPAEEAGLQRGDVILEINGKTIEGLKNYNQQIEKMTPGKPALMLVRREKNTIFLTLKIQ